jgi:ribonucleoside-diphosphate reductase alpha chain
MMVQGLNLSETSRALLSERYLRRDDTGTIVEDADGMLRRVARAIAAPAVRFGENSGFWEARFLERMRCCEFLPNSPTLMNAGIPGGQLAACFVLPIEDDLESIFSALRRMACIHQSGGGTGFSFSALRPRDDRVRSTGGVASGPLSFMEIFDRTTAVIRRGGRRRGANMAVLRIDHPDIEEFIDAKNTPGRLENFNLSVGTTDAFWSACDTNGEVPLLNPRTRNVVHSIAARALLEKIIAAAWATGDPGLLFLDEINRHNPTPKLGTIEATNPCGEQPLLPYESCTLGSVNLAAFAAEGAIDWSKLGAAIDDAVVFLDNVIEANHYPCQQVAAATRRTRKIGLGVMGLADLFARLGIPYDSEKAVSTAQEIASFLTERARASSVELGKRRGPFPAFQDSVWPQRGFSTLRHAAVSCVAPTGTISLFAGISSSIEPFFALGLSRRMLDGRLFTEINPLVEAELAKLGAAGAVGIKAIREHGSIRGLSNLPAQLRRCFPIALEIAPEWHVRMQAAFQRFVDAGASKTVNMPADSSLPDVAAVFELARGLGLKGITVYRYGARKGQSLSLIDSGARPDCRECAV